jgi:hypothetical protein
MKNRIFLYIAAATLVLSAAPMANADKPRDEGAFENDPVYIVQTLMNNNYMNMKNLYVPIMNYGGGEKEFNTLLDSYSRGMTLYLHRRMTEAADLFKKNEAEIRTLAEKIAKKYREDTERLHALAIKMYIQAKIAKSMSDRSVETEVSQFTTGDIYINNASDSIRMANRYLESGRPVDAIVYYRQSKVYCFEAYDTYHVKLPNGYELDLADNGNLVFAGSEKPGTCVNC